MQLPHQTLRTILFPVSIILFPILPSTPSFRLLYLIVKKAYNAILLNWQSWTILDEKLTKFPSQNNLLGSDYQQSYFLGVTISSQKGDIDGILKPKMILLIVEISTLPTTTARWLDQLVNWFAPMCIANSRHFPYARNNVKFWFNYGARGGYNLGDICCLHVANIGYIPKRPLEAKFPIQFIIKYISL